MSAFSKYFYEVEYLLRYFLSIVDHGKILINVCRHYFESTTSENLRNQCLRLHLFSGRRCPWKICNVEKNFQFEKIINKNFSIRKNV